MRSLGKLGIEHKMSNEGEWRKRAPGKYQGLEEHRTSESGGTTPVRKSVPIRHSSMLEIELEPQVLRSNFFGHPKSTMSLHTGSPVCCTQDAIIRLPDIVIPLKACHRFSPL